MISQIGKSKSKEMISSFANVTKGNYKEENMKFLKSLNEWVYDEFKLLSNKKYNTLLKHLK